MSPLARRIVDELETAAVILAAEAALVVVGAGLLILVAGGVDQAALILAVLGYAIGAGL